MYLESLHPATMHLHRNYRPLTQNKMFFLQIYQIFPSKKNIQRSFPPSAASMGVWPVSPEPETIFFWVLCSHGDMTSFGHTVKKKYECLRTKRMIETKVNICNVRNMGMLQEHLSSNACCANSHAKKTGQNRLPRCTPWSASAPTNTRGARLLGFFIEKHQPVFSKKQ